MIERVYEQVQQSKLIDQVIVATDDARIEKEVHSFGGQVMMTSTQHQSGTERCGEVIESHQGFDVVINIQGDEPLIQPEQIDQVLTLFREENVEIGTLVKAFRSVENIHNPNRVKAVLNGNAEAIYFSRSPIPYSVNPLKDSDLITHQIWKHIGIYAWRMETLKALLKLPASPLESMESLEQLRWLYHGYNIKTAETFIETPNIDTPEDLEKVIRELE